MNITIPNHRLSREEALEMLPDYDAIILARQKADREFIDATSKLKMIVTPSAGFDSIDVDLCHIKTHQKGFMWQIRRLRFVSQLLKSH